MMVKLTKQDKNLIRITKGNFSQNNSYSIRFIDTNVLDMRDKARFLIDDFPIIVGKLTITN